MGEKIKLSKVKPVYEPELVLPKETPNVGLYAISGLNEKLFQPQFD